MVRMEASTAGSRSPMDSAGTDVDGSRATLKITLFVSSSITSNSRKSTLYVLAERGHRNSALHRSGHRGHRNLYRQTHPLTPFSTPFPAARREHVIRSAALGARALSCAHVFGFPRSSRFAISLAKTGVFSFTGLCRRTVCWFFEFKHRLRRNLVRIAEIYHRPRERRVCLC